MARRKVVDSPEIRTSIVWEKVLILQDPGKDDETGRAWRQLLTMKREGRQHRGPDPEQATFLKILARGFSQATIYKQKSPSAPKK